MCLPMLSRWLLLALLLLAPSPGAEPRSSGTAAARNASAEPSCAISWRARPLSPAQRRFACDLENAARESGAPLTALVAIWARECSLDPVCPKKRSVDPLSFGPMQITRKAAQQHGCDGPWDTIPSANARCAARIVTDWRADPRTRGRWTLVFTAYHLPRDLIRFKGRASGYGMQVYLIMLSLEMAHHESGSVENRREKSTLYRK